MMTLRQILDQEPESLKHGPASQSNYGARPPANRSAQTQRLTRKQIGHLLDDFMLEGGTIQEVTRQPRSDGVNRAAQGSAGRMRSLRRGRRALRPEPLGRRGSNVSNRARLRELEFFNGKMRPRASLSRRVRLVAEHTPGRTSSIAGRALVSTREMLVRTGARPSAQ
jgi:hypothetical protein